MPLVTLRLGATPDRHLAARAAALLHQLTVTHLGKRPELIATAVDFIDPATWFVAGRSLADSGLRSYHLTITITDETNLKAEKSRFMAAVHAALGDLLGPLHEESYIHVHDVRAAAYGYGGRTQEWRAHHADPA
ncbi:tautomerase family protein [Aquabacterium sp. OR-4]|uniref:tautomerase family protein n=1 Tax=Aquabacterium sp. OR-4 TaxID=2978127 RepID=UPI0021B24FA9|nr:4-oxalocrotonate tautomerase [Aquabacterium sp. OR-4]MDT7833749.1 4-oxalocrotonate tautomerase [Aquabacterium sp. OR-4]